jgi:serine phosphatase RsbU (regulator of sigma subunit)
MEIGLELQYREEFGREKFLDMLGTNMLASADDSGFQSLQNLASKHEKDDLCKRPS